MPRSFDITYRHRERGGEGGGESDRVSATQRVRHTESCEVTSSNLSTALWL